MIYVTQFGYWWSVDEKQLKSILEGIVTGDGYDLSRYKQLRRKPRYREGICAVEVLDWDAATARDALRSLQQSAAAFCQRFASEEFWDVMDETAWVQEEVLDAIQRSYSAWLERRAIAPRAPEPKLTTAVLVDFVADRSADFRWMSRREQTSLVRSAVRKLERRGEIQSSIGIGESGREARMWEPALKGATE